MKKNFPVLLILFALCGHVYAQGNPVKPKMTYMGAYDSGQAGVSIHKLFDPTEDVVCYVLMPDQAGRREGVGGGWIYDGNSVGSMSCLKVRLAVVPVAAPSKPTKN